MVWRRAIVLVVLLLGGACSGDDSGDGATDDAGATTEVPAADGPKTTTTTAAGDGTALPVSEVFDPAGDTAEPFAFDAAADDCGFEAKYGPTVTECVAVEVATGDWAVVLHDLGPRRVAVLTCGDDGPDHSPTLTADDAYAAGAWATAEGADAGTAAYVLIGIDGDGAQLEVVSRDPGIGDGCPIAYGVGEFSAGVEVGAQHGSLRIVDGDQRWCVTRTGPGAFVLGAAAPPDTAC